MIEAPTSSEQTKELPEMTSTDLHRTSLCGSVYTNIPEPMNNPRVNLTVKPHENNEPIKITLFEEQESLPATLCLTSKKNALELGE